MFNRVSIKLTFNCSGVASSTDDQTNRLTSDSPLTTGHGAARPGFSQENTAPQEGL